MEKTQSRYIIHSSSSIELKELSDFSAYKMRIQNNEQAIENVWNDTQSKRGEKPFFNGQIFNVMNIEERDTSMIIVGHAIEYKHYIAQKNGVELGVVPLAVSGLTWFAQGDKKRIVMAKRSTYVTQYPNHYECVPSGSIDCPSDYIKQTKSELSEEIGVDDDGIKNIAGFCVIKDTEQGIVLIGVDVEIISNSEFKLNNSEYSEICHVDNDNIGQFMIDNKVVDMMPLLIETWKVNHE